MQYRLIVSVLFICVPVLVSAKSSFTKSPISDSNAFSTHLYILPDAGLKHAAELGDVEAQFQLGWQYSITEDEKRLPTLGHSLEEAEHWYRQAARQGHAPSAYNMAVIMAQGRGVPANQLEAYAWLDFAAALGHGPSQTLKTDILNELSLAEFDGVQAVQERLIPQYVLSRIE